MDNKDSNLQGPSERLKHTSKLHQTIRRWPDICLLTPTTIVWTCSLHFQSSWREGKAKEFLEQCRKVGMWNVYREHLGEAKELQGNPRELGFPCTSVSKEPACNAGDRGSIPGLERSPGEEDGNPLQYACLENPMDRGAWQATVHGVVRVWHDWATQPPPPPRNYRHGSRESDTVIAIAFL